MEDALKRLDRLTLDEARMAAAQTLKLAHGIDSQVKVVDDKVTGVDIKLKGVDDKVTGVEVKMKDVDEKVTGVNIKMKDVDEKVTGVDIKMKDVDDKVDTILDGILSALCTRMHHSDCAYIRE